MASLVSGLIGALIATILSIFYNYITEQVRYRREIMLKVVEWAEDVYDCVEQMSVQKNNKYTNKKPCLTDEEYRNTSREVLRMLKSSKLVAMVALTYGEGEAVQKMNALKGELLEILSSLYTSNKEKWTEVNESIEKKFSDIIDPLRASIHREFLLRAKVSSIIKDFIKCKMPTFWKLTDTQKGKKEGIVEKENFLKKNWLALIAILISIVYPSVNMYLNHFKAASLTIKESVNFVLQNKNNETLIYLPVIFNNEGARTGVIDAVFMYIFDSENELYFNTGAFFETSDLEINNREMKPFLSFYVNGRDTKNKIIITSIRKAIKEGRYTCAIVAVTSKREKLTSIFDFNLDSNKIEFLNSSEGMMSIPTNKLSGIQKELETELLAQIK